MNYIHDKSRIANSFKSEEQLIKGEEILLTQEDMTLIKGKPVSPIGTKKLISGRTYIKTADGWKYFGKGTGSKAQEHHGHAQAAAGGGAPIKPGSKITSGGVTGTVKHHDEHETHIEYQDKEGRTQLSKQKTEDVHAAIADNKFEHAVPAGSISEKDAQDESFDINKRFKAFELFTNAVIQGKMKSMSAYGSGGVGKTYTITTQLKKAGKKEFDEEKNVPGDEDYDYVKITGKMTGPQVYKTLFQHNGKILLFDDCDSVLRDGTAINLFKGALDTSGDGTISYGTSAGVKGDEDENGESTKIPKRFKFTGRCLFASNLPPDQIPQPLKSRGYNVDLTMNKDQTMSRLKDISTDKEGKLQNLKFPGIDKYSHKDMSDILGHLNEVKDKMHADLSVRTIGSLLGIKQMSDEVGDDWKEHASHMLFSKSQDMNILDGESLQKSRSMQLLKSYGVDIDKALIKSNSAVTSKDYFDGDAQNELVKSQGREGEDIMLNKGQIAERLVYGYGSGTTKPLEFSKTGKELKEKIPAVLAALNQKKGEIVGKMDLLKQQAGVEPTNAWHTDVASGISIMRYPYEICNDSNTVKAVEAVATPSLTGSACNDYNEWCWTLRDLLDDINALTVIQANLKDDQKYTLSVGQLMALQFN
jgi:hypothetical protein